MISRRDGQRKSSRTSTDMDIGTADMRGKRGQGEANYGRELRAVAVAQRRMANAEPIGSGENGVSRLR